MEQTARDLKILAIQKRIDYHQDMAAISLAEARDLLLQFDYQSPDPRICNFMCQHDYHLQMAYREKKSLTSLRNLHNANAEDHQNETDRA